MLLDLCDSRARVRSVKSGGGGVGGWRVAWRRRSCTGERTASGDVAKLVRVAPFVVELLEPGRVADEEEAADADAAIGGTAAR